MTTRISVFDLVDDSGAQVFAALMKLNHVQEDKLHDGCRFVTFRHGENDRPHVLVFEPTNLGWLADLLINHRFQRIGMSFLGRHGIAKDYQP